jgi:hypothetical protein
MGGKPMLEGGSKVSWRACKQIAQHRADWPGIRQHCCKLGLLAFH